MPTTRHGTPAARSSAADHASPPQRTGAVVAEVVDRSDRRDPRRSHRRDHRREHGHDDADRERRHDGAVLDDERALGHVEARADRRARAGPRRGPRLPRDRAPMPPVRRSRPRRRPTTTTWRPLAPMARSSPSSRVRCATRIVNVLKMMNAPTTRPDRREPEEQLRQQREEVTEVTAAIGRERARGRHLEQGAESLLDAGRELAGAPRRAPPGRSLRRASPRASNARCAVARSNAAKVTAELGSVRSPNAKSPDDAERLLRPVEEDSTLSPTGSRAPPRCPTSIATSSSARRAPAVDEPKGDESQRGRAVTQVMPSVGAPPFWIDSPSRPTNCA